MLGLQSFHALRVKLFSLLQQRGLKKEVKRKLDSSVCVLMPVGVTYDPLHSPLGHPHILTML